MVEMWYSFEGRQEIIHKSGARVLSTLWIFFFLSVFGVFHLHKKVIGCLLKYPNAAVVAREKSVLIIISLKF